MLRRLWRGASPLRCHGDATAGPGLYRQRALFPAIHSWFGISDLSACERREDCNVINRPTSREEISAIVDFWCPVTHPGASFLA